MGGEYRPSFWEAVITQMLVLVILIFLPVIWIILILRGLVFILFRPSEAKITLKETVAIISTFSAVPFAITFVHCRILIGKVRSLPQAFSNHTRRTALPHVGSIPDGAESHSPVPEPSRHGSPPLTYQMKHRYSPLNGVDEFRLLIIFPGAFSNSLRGEVVTTSFSSVRQPTYDALSYTWADETGDADRSGEFLCENDDSFIRITKNCEAAIRRLRHPRKKRRVWIDAICINQDSDSERTHQVSIMSRIYISARHVVVYTGEGTAQTNMLFNWLNGLKTEDLEVLSRWDLDNLAGEVATSLERYWDMGRERLLALVRDPGAGKQKVDVSEAELIELAREYFSRRWFKRVWVLQEVALPDIRNTIVICGTKATTAMRALHVLSLLYQDPSGSIIRIFVLLRKRMKGLERSHLLDVLIETRNREAGDSRDKIFGVLSISNFLDKGKFLGLDANYAMTTLEVYAYYSAYFIQHYGPGFFFSLIKSPPRLVGLPSWAADWTVPWPNYKAVCGRDFAAASRSANDKDSKGIFMEESGCPVLKLVRSKIRQGYFTRNGHLDGSNDIHIEGLEDLGEDEILIEMYPGLAALLKKKDNYYIFAQVCPHALSEHSVEELVGRWSSVVVDAEGPKDQIGQDPRSFEYLGLVETFTIR